MKTIPLENKFAHFYLDELKEAGQTRLDRLKEIRGLKPSEVTQEIQTELREILDDLEIIRVEIDRKRGTEMPLSGMNPLSDGEPTTTVRAKEGTMSTRSYRSMFYKNQPNALENGDFKDLGEFLRSFNSGRFDPRIDALEQRGMVEGILSSGGALVPEAFGSEMLDASLPQEIVRQRAQVFPMTSETLIVPGWDGADMSEGKVFGGFEMEFLAEGAEGTKQTPRTRLVHLRARTGAIYVDASLELTQDGVNFGQNLESALIKSVGYGIDKHCLTGDGAGKPLGILNSPCKVQVQKESGQAAGSLVYANLKKMFARQLRPDQAVWVFNSTAIPDLLELVVNVGTGGDVVKVLNESNGQFTIFGRPCLFTSHMPATGEEDDVLFADFSFYALGLRKDVGIDVTDAHRWTQRERSYRVLLRFDGQPLLDQAIRPENGDSLSPFVTLAARE